MRLRASACACRREGKRLDVFILSHGARQSAHMYDIRFLRRLSDGCARLYGGAQYVQGQKTHGRIYFSDSGHGSKLGYAHYRRARSAERLDVPARRQRI